MMVARIGKFYRRICYVNTDLLRLNRNDGMIQENLDAKLANICEYENCDQCAGLER